MKPLFTPGPWMMAARPSSIVGWPIVGQQGRSICSLSWFSGLPEEAMPEIRANGLLIATAPEMYAALTATVPVLEAVQRVFIREGWAKEFVTGGPLITAIEHALAKADGKMQ